MCSQHLGAKLSHCSKKPNGQIQLIENFTCPSAPSGDGGGTAPNGSVRYKVHNSNNCTSPALGNAHVNSVNAENARKTYCSDAIYNGKELAICSSVTSNTGAVSSFFVNKFKCVAATVGGGKGKK